MLSVEDLRNPGRKSGFDGVRFASSPASPSPKPYQANKRVAPGKNGIATLGPRRATAEEAAQDYCDYINGTRAAHTAPLKTAGHKGPNRPVQSDEERQLRRRLRELEAARNKHRKGYVYLVGEQGSCYAVKIGHSYDPETRPNGLQTGNPRRLVVLGSTEGTLEDEAALHQRYIEDNVLQEWFRPSEALLAEFGVTWSHYIKTCGAGVVR